MRYPLPLLDISLRKLSGKRFHAILDLTQGFHQLRMAEDSKWLTGLYEWNVLPFSVKNGPAICIVFIDDIDAFGRISH